MQKIQDQVGAFINQDCQVAGNSSGKLHNLRFGLKDIYDVAGYSTSFGNPTWLSTHPVATTTNSAIQGLEELAAVLIMGFS
jgi:amidase